ncbi:protein FAM166B isoform X2 [Dromiciops gliroides]|uniref:protein FAM166B isoform X2 n=1 Tax=Dromiciops gliroides TaxID=33562 RepID=UPI001CC36D73|nr:protein FAM166B isoform X2 [Dromiciops gliroides]
MASSAFPPGLPPRGPYYIPGYTGHCPQLGFGLGKTYGQLTGQLLLSGPSGLAWPPAQRMLLPPINTPGPPRADQQSWHGHERIKSNMIPGYTGFVPRSQHIFAKRCTQVWTEALRDFTSRLGTGYKELPEAEKKELESKTEDEESEPEKHLQLELEPGQKPKASPYSMDDQDPDKFFISGFTGYVPRARFHFGSSFPILTNQALQEFGQMCPGARGQRDQRDQRDQKPLPSLSRTYLQHLGMVPSYRGYVPASLGSTGYKFQFGHTYGTLTHDALGLRNFQKQLQSYFPQRQAYC